MPSFGCAHYMTSFDIESVFTNISLEGIVNICVDKLFENKPKVNNLTKSSFQSLLELATLDYFFNFDTHFPNWVQLWLMSFYAILKNNGCLIALLSDCPVNLFHIEAMLKSIFKVKVKLVMVMGNVYVIMVMKDKSSVYELMDFMSRGLIIFNLHAQVSLLCISF